MAICRHCGLTYALLVVEQGYRMCWPCYLAFEPERSIQRGFDMTFDTVQDAVYQVVNEHIKGSPQQRLALTYRRAILTRRRYPLWYRDN